MRKVFYVAEFAQFGFAVVARGFDGVCFTEFQGESSYLRRLL
jgi:hypothetical protein